MPVSTCISRFSLVQCTANESQVAGFASVLQILENHRREVHNSLRQDRRLGGHLNSPVLVPEAFNDDDDDDRQSPAADDIDVKDTDISKDFEDLKNFVQETQSRSRLYEDSLHDGDSVDGGGSLEDPGDESRNSGRVGSGFDTHNRDRDFPPLPDFSEFDQIDFNSGELDPDLLQVICAVSFFSFLLCVCVCVCVCVCAVSYTHLTLPTTAEV